MNPLTQSKRTPILPLRTALTMARLALALAASLGLLLGFALPATAKNPNAENLYGVHKLQSDVPGEAAMTDPDLVNITCALQNEDGDEEVANGETK